MKKLLNFYQILIIFLIFPCTLNANLIINKVNNDAEFKDRGLFFCPFNKPLKCGDDAILVSGGDNTREYGLWDFTKIEFKILDESSNEIFYVGYHSNQKGSVNAKYLKNFRLDALNGGEFYTKRQILPIDLKNIPLYEFLNTYSNSLYCKQVDTGEVTLVEYNYSCPTGYAKTTAQEYEKNKRELKKIAYCKSDNKNKVLKSNSGLCPLDYREIDKETFRTHAFNLKKNNFKSLDDFQIKYYPYNNGLIYEKGDPNSKYVGSYKKDEPLIIDLFNLIDSRNYWPIKKKDGLNGFVTDYGNFDIVSNKFLFDKSPNNGSLIFEIDAELDQKFIDNYQTCYFDYDPDEHDYSNWGNICDNSLKKFPKVKVLRIKNFYIKNDYTTHEKDFVNFAYVEFHNKKSGWVYLRDLNKNIFLKNLLSKYGFINTNEKDIKTIYVNKEDYIMNKKSYVTADILNIRDDIKGKIIDKAVKNQKLAILDNQKSWSKIVTESGLTGWVSSQYLSSKLVEYTNEYIFCWDNSADVSINFENIKSRKGKCLSGEQKIQRDFICSNKSMSAKKLLEDCAKFPPKNQIVNLDPKNIEPNLAQDKKIVEIDNSPSQKLDNIAPKITCDTVDTINTSVANIKCKISDDNELFAVVVNGNQIVGDLENLNEQIQVPFGNSKIEVVAYDFFGNKENLILNVNREFSLVNSQEEIEQLFPGKIKDKSSNNKVAVIIGIQNYADIPDTKYSDKDAMAFAEFANQTLNIPSKNIKYLFNEDAKYFGFKGIQTWLENKVNKNTDVYVFYSGHGLGVEGKSKLLPSDFVTQFQEESSYEKDEFLSDIANLNPNHIYAFFDTCFSGLGRNGETLVAGLKNISIVEEVAPVDNITIFNSSSGLEYSTDFDEAGHGLFSYYLMKGLEGNADINADNEITSKELFSFISDNVSDRALDIGLSQNPSLIGKSNNVIVRW